MLFIVPYGQIDELICKFHPNNLHPITHLLGIQQPDTALHLHSLTKQLMYKVMNSGAIILI